jgi:uncharacterized protein (TIGR00730 family)
MKKLCVFCGSSFGTKEEYINAARQLGALIASNGISLVYGGARVGLMGEIASSVLACGGSVTGVIPKQLSDKEIAHPELTELHVVGSMHERKALMAQLSDGFIAMPGGLGTLEEIFEMITWAQLNFHAKPCGFLNTAGYYNHLIKFLDYSVTEKFVRPEHYSMIAFDDNPEALLNKMRNFSPPVIDKTKLALSEMGREERG